ncbi:MAG TPA: oligopeptide:H+ symporter [Gemmataceae bacterium]|nr:oligopeptide:H+ symporter [Gemmataceae bacterium]
MSTSAEAPASADAPKLPRQIAYIIGNEGCERFSFYGMRNILTQFLVSSALLAGVSGVMSQGEREAAAKEVFHTFVLGVYFFPLLGGWLADRFLGKYRTILYLSLIYCVGQALLAAFVTNKAGFYTGLFLIALGSGGIKPCVSAFVGDQFDKSNKALARVVFDAFYWIINFGSFFASLLMPWTLRHYGPEWAFGIPGILMFISTVILWLGRRLYVDVPPAPPHPDSFVRVVRNALAARGPDGAGRPGRALALVGAVVAAVCVGLGFYDLWRMLGLGLKPTLGVAQWWCMGLVVAIGFTGVGTWWQLDRARASHPDEAVDGARSVLRILVLFALVTPFWSLFDQKASTWVLQANGMTKPSWFEPSQMQALNPLLVMLLIPFNNLVLYPALKRRGVQPTALRRMTAGIAFSGLSWIVAGVLQVFLEAGTPVSIAWQILPYALLTLGEVLVSATGLEFAYSQAPAPMKGAIMAFWSLSVTVGNLWVLLANAAVKNDGVTRAITQSGMGLVSFQMFFFAAFALVAAVAFGVYAARYPLADHYRTKPE